jgi:DNA-binding SARP family transcriptional activator
MFGVFSIAFDGERVADDLGPAGRIFSSYLFAFTGRVHRRERLADEFWGHLDPERARAALNTALWRLRKILAREPRSEGGRNLQTRGCEIILEHASWLDVDTHRFDAAVRQLLNPRYVEANGHQLDILETAVETYAAPFLEGEDADWILEERERLHSLYVRAACELVRAYGRTERYEEAIATARRILASDPFRESIHRDLTILLVLNGQRADAMRHHQKWAALFKRELGIDPMPETLELADEIRSGRIFERLTALQASHFCQSSEKSRGDVAAVPLQPKLERSSVHIVTRGAR